MRIFFSYILLISLLSPTAVETFHALHDSHDISTKENISIHESEFHCKISLFSNQEDDLDLFLNHSYESYISHNFKSTFKQYKVLLTDTVYNIHLNRGPPVLA